MNHKPVAYQVKLADPDGHRLQVRLSIAQPDPAGQLVRMAAWIPGSYLIRDFARQVETIHASSASGPLAIHKIDDHSWQCQAHSGPIHIEYSVYAWDLSVRGAHFDASHAFFNGTSIFLAVHGQEHKPCLLNLCAPEHTQDWRVFTSLPVASGYPDCAEPGGFGCYLAPDFDALIDHPVEIGTPQSISFQAGGATHELVFTGHAPKLDLARIAADAQKICTAQIRLFDPEHGQAPCLDSSARYVFLTTITAAGYGGLEHRASTALITRRADLPSLGKPVPEGYTSFLGLLSHEYFHSWNIKRIKPAAFVPYRLDQPNHTHLLWVFEGFTSYYDDLMLLRAGVIDESAYFKLLGRVFEHVLNSGGRHKQSVAASSFDAWTRYYKQDENSPNALVSYYTKGALLALSLDLQIRTASANKYSLDDVMRYMWLNYGRDFYRQPPARGVGEQDMAAIIMQATGLDLADYIQQYAYGCSDLPLASQLAQSGIELSGTAKQPQRPSLNVRSKDGHGGQQLLTVHEFGPAHQAGLAAGDILIAIDRLRITDQASLDQALERYQTGDQVVIHAFRDDLLLQFETTLGPAWPIAYSLQRLQGAQA